MRMWGVNPRIMCRRHLLGEHVEMHMAVGAFRRGRSLDWMLGKGLLVPYRVRGRHDELAGEMQRRGYRHGSPIDDEICEAIAAHFEGWEFVWSESSNESDLIARCDECRKRRDEQR